MTARLVLVAAAFVFVSATACDSEPEDTVERAAAIALEIRATPANAEAILEEHELTIEEFEALMYEVAADPELSERYEQLIAGDE